MPVQQQDGTSALRMLKGSSKAVKRRRSQRASQARDTVRCYNCHQVGNVIISSKCPSKPALYNDNSTEAAGAPMCQMPEDCIRQEVSCFSSTITNWGLAMVVGPIPGSRSGKKYILVICDSNSYLETIPHCSIDAKHITEELLSVFTYHGSSQGDSHRPGHQFNLSVTR